MHEVDGSDYLFLSKEVVNQRVPLAKINYVIGILLIIRELCNTHLQVSQTWYADDAGAGGNFAAI